jgi:hypothetical protein
VQRAREAERLLRDYLTSELGGTKSTHWRTGETRSRLGGALQRDSLSRLVRLYEAWGKPEKVAGWQQRLADFDKTEAKTEAKAKPGSPEP